MYAFTFDNFSGHVIAQFGSLFVSGIVSCNEDLRVHVSVPHIHVPSMYLQRGDQSSGVRLKFRCYVFATFHQMHAWRQFVPSKTGIHQNDAFLKFDGKLDFGVGHIPPFRGKYTGRQYQDDGFGIADALLNGIFVGVVLVL